MIVEIKKIFFPVKERLRRPENYDLVDFSNSFSKIGQISAVVVRPFDKEEFPDEHGYDWVLDNGGRRIMAISFLHEKNIPVREYPGAPRMLPRGYIRVELRQEIANDPLENLLVEFYANDAKEFDWKEKAEFVRRVHEISITRSIITRDEFSQSEFNKPYDGLSDEEKQGLRNAPGFIEEWTPAYTAAALRMSENTVYQYLQLTADEEVFSAPEVQSSDSFHTARKKSKLVRDRKKRQMVIDHIEQQELDAQNSGEAREHDRDVRAATMARAMLVNKDVRDWIKLIKDQEFDWFHWDPPFGGEQDGGAFTTHELINDTWGYARDLHAHVIPEIWRTLRDGRWLAIWCHQSSSKMDYMRRLLQGHDLGVKGHKAVCVHCGKDWNELDTIIPCKKTHTPFWVNPYAVIWNKVDRQADGHEITRFLRNDYETLLLAAKWHEEEPILANSNTGNVLSHPMIPRADRRHVMHKPSGVIQQVLSIISYPGELGGDGGAGSCSIHEACIDGGRKIKACELSRNYYVDGISLIKQKVLDVGLV